MKEDLKDKIENWLNTQGYNLELLTAKVFQNNEFKVAQSVYYFDADNNQTRETDLVCYHTQKYHGVHFHLTFVVECKKSTDKPWLVFKSSKEFKKYGGFDTIDGTLNGLELIDEIGKIKNVTKKKAVKFLGFQTSSFGHGVTQAFTSGIDTTYGATTTVLKAIRYFAEKHIKNNLPVCCLYFPLIVVDGRLFEVELKENNETGIVEVAESKIVVIRSDLNKTNMIQIVTKDHLEVFCKDLKSQCLDFFKHYARQIKKIAKNSPLSGLNLK